MDDALTKILEKLDQLDKKVDTIGSEVKEIKTRNKSTSNGNR
ncbi:hypothetical protein [Xenorhabdus szentirmaii]|nr:hypothetical protein [Xenorhabdus sp. M]